MGAYLVAAWVTAVLGGTDAASSPAAPARFHFERATDWPVSVVVDGASCADASVKIRLGSMNQMEPYVFEAPYRSFVGTDCSTGTAQKFVANERIDISPRSLPRFPAADEARDRGLEILVPEATYDELRTPFTRVFRHPSGGRKVRWVVFPWRVEKGAPQVATGVPVLDQELESLRKTSAARLGEKRKSIAFTDETRIAFSSRDAADRIRVSVTSDNCADATLVVEISSADGRELYRREEDSKCEPDEVEEAVEAALNNAGLEHTGAFFASHPFLGDEKTFHDGYRIIVPRETYERIGAADTEVVEVKTGSEDWEYVAYDPDSKKGIVVIQAGTWD